MTIDVGKTVVVRSPGRINIIGEHTDYNDGFVLPAAIDRETIFSLSPNSDPEVCHVTAEDLGEDFTFRLKDFGPLANGWQNYVMGVVSELQKLDGKIRGFTASFRGTVPIGSGMSSSAALECCLAMGLNELFSLGFDKWQLVKASQMAENHFVGMQCGIMDQFASMMGKKDHAVLLDCRTLEFEYFPLNLEPYGLMLINSNVVHELASSEYNTRRSEASEGVKAIQKSLPDVTSLRDITPETLKIFRSQLSPKVYARCKHVVTENERVLEATRVMQTGDLDRLGKLLYASHESLSKDYEVSCKELDFLVEATRGNPFILGSRMMGGGFGGCTINLIHKSAKRAFIDETFDKYARAFGWLPTVYEVEIADGTSIL